MTKTCILTTTSIFSLLLFSCTVIAAELNTKIDAVTVYINGAQIARTGNLSVKPGKTVIECKGISPYINNQSLSVKGIGNFIILSTSLKTDYSKQKVDDAKTDSLNTIQRIIKKEKQNLSTRLNVLTQIETLVEDNTNLGDKENAVSTENLKAMMNLYKSDLLPVLIEKKVIKNEIDSLAKIENNLTQQLKNNMADNDLPKIIVIEIEAKSSEKADFKISYFAEGASWQPVYDIRVDDLSKPIQLVAKANVTQITGEDWENVDLTFSSGEPNVGGVAPELLPWYLSFKSRNYSNNNAGGLYNPSVKKVTGRVIDSDFGEPLIGVTVIVKGTSVGTVTDIDGFYSINIPIGTKQLTYSYIGMQAQTVNISKPIINVKMENSGAVLDEVVVVGSRTPPRSSIYKLPKKMESKKAEAKFTESIAEQTPTVLTFKIDQPFSIPSNNQSKTINLASYKMDASYTHYAVPKIETTAYLIASISNWSRYNLLQGEANIYFENTFITETIIDAQSFNDTLSISLGPDRNIALKRVKDEDFCKTKILSANTNQSIGFNIDIRNNRKQQINLECYDQIPVSKIDDIKVKSINISKGTLNEKTGIIKWKMKMMPSENKKLQLAYEVKYPKRKNVILE